jgi:glycosyltransferase involved in cell wall biosynthesis
MKPKILFYGTFGNQTVSGNGAACHLLMESEAMKRFEFITIDSSLTLAEIKHNGWLKRILRVVKRFAKTIRIVLFQKPETALIFCNDGFSFLEKSFYSLLLKTFGVGVILAPRSGLILKDVQHKWFEAYLELVLKKSNRIIAQGEYWKTFYKRFVNERKIVIVPNWIKWKDTTKTYDRPVFRFVFIGWLYSYKNVSCLIEASKLLYKEGFTFKVDIYGEGIEREKLAKKVLKLGMDEFISFEGWANKETKERIWEQHNVLILPSKFEGMPNVILEAMNNGIPVIASDIATHPELILHRESGLLFESDNAADLAEQMKHCLEHSESLTTISSVANKKLAAYDVEIGSRKVAGLINSVLVEKK